MCGISGLWHSPTLPSEELVARARRMSEQLKHRGPDDSGVFVDPGAGIALGHRRLSVVDLSAHGHQPMASANGRYVITYNGEAFNHQQLHRELVSQGATFRGHSDTEVIVTAVEHWGLERTLQRLNGMFAFALWDREQRTLSLVRDRVGIKPLYYGWVGRMFVFASELKAIQAPPGFNNEINRDAIALFMRHGYIPAPYSIFRGIYKLLPGTWLPVEERTARQPLEIGAIHPLTRTYWSARGIAEDGAAHRNGYTDEEAVDELDTLLRDAVKIRMEADVPLGAFLSGGIDSSTIAALMQVQASRPVKTFSIGFGTQDINEAPFAKAVAAHLGTDHQELYLTARDALDIVPELPTIFDEPFADPSQIPTLFVSRLARNAVTVSLSGDGGDELFGGYSRYFEAERYRRLTAMFPRMLLNSAAAALKAPQGSLAYVMGRAARLLPSQLRPKNPLSMATRLGNMLGAANDSDRYLHLITHWDDALRVVKNSSEVPTNLTHELRNLALLTPFERMMYADLVSYLPDDCLTKVDRASMSASLEARVPLLDHRVVEFAWRTPLRQKVRTGQGKWILRQVLQRYVPRTLVDRPKAGFGAPIGDWLHGPLHEWAEALLDERRLREEGFFDPLMIRQAWNTHASGETGEPYRLWNVLMFQAWLEHFQNAR